MAKFLKVAVNVKGRVQGVFYRQSTRETASRLRLAGWVSNLPDGTVAVEAQGPADQVSALLNWLKVGPPSASVSSVDVENEEEIDAFDLNSCRFEIRN